MPIQGIQQIVKSSRKKKQKAGENEIPKNDLKNFPELGG